MSYLTIKYIKGNPYLYEVHSEREGDRVRQVFDAYWGRADAPGAMERRPRVSRRERRAEARAKRVPLMPMVSTPEVTAPKVIEEKPITPEVTEVKPTVEERTIPKAEVVTPVTLEVTKIKQVEAYKPPETLSYGLSTKRAIELGEDPEYPRMAAAVFHFDELTTDEKKVVIAGKKQELDEALQERKTIYQQAKDFGKSNKEMGIKPDLNPYPDRKRQNAETIDRLQKQIQIFEGKVVTPEVTKEPWEMTKVEYSKIVKAGRRVDVPTLSDLAIFVKEKKGASGITKEAGYFPAFDTEMPESPNYIYRDINGDIRGILSINVVEGQEPQVSIAVHPGKTTVGKDLIEAAIADGWDIPTLLGKQDLTKSGARFAHRLQVEKALQEGKSVPPEVLKDYPELVKPAVTPEVKPSEVSQEKVDSILKELPPAISKHIESFKIGGVEKGAHASYNEERGEVSYASEDEVTLENTAHELAHHWAYTDLIKTNPEFMNKFAKAMYDDGLLPNYDKDNTYLTNWQVNQEFANSITDYITRKPRLKFKPNIESLVSRELGKSLEVAKPIEPTISPAERIPEKAMEKETEPKKLERAITIYEDFIRRDNLFNKDFNKKINDASVYTEWHMGKLSKELTGKAMTVREALSPTLASQYSDKVLDTEVWLASNVNDKPFRGFAIGTTPEGKRILFMHPSQAESDYVKSMVHELKHLSDEYSGKVVSVTGEDIYSKEIKIPSERRARVAEEAVLRKLYKQQLITKTKPEVATTPERVEVEPTPIKKEPKQPIAHLPKYMESTRLEDNTIHASFEPRENVKVDIRTRRRFGAGVPDNTPEFAPQDFDIKQESNLVAETINEVDNALEEPNMRRAIKSAFHVDWSSGQRPTSKASVTVILTDEAKDVGMGSAGEGSAKVFWSPYSNRALYEKGKSEFGMLGVDPIATLAHEYHHALGGAGELDMFSDAIGAKVHLRHNLELIDPKYVKDWIWSNVNAIARSPKSHHGLESREALGFAREGNPILFDKLLSETGYSPEALQKVKDQITITTRKWKALERQKPKPEIISTPETTTAKVETRQPEVIRTEITIEPTKIEEKPVNVFEKDFIERSGQPEFYTPETKPRILFSKLVSQTYNPEQKGNVRNVHIGKVGEKTAWADGFMLEIKPVPEKLKAIKGYRELGETTEGKPRDFTNLVPDYSTEGVEVAPILKTPLEAIKGNVTFLASKDKDQAIAMDSKYVDYFMANYPDAKFITKKLSISSPIVVQSGGQTAGVIMPIFKEASEYDTFLRYLRSNVPATH